MKLFSACLNLLFCVVFPSAIAQSTGGGDSVQVYTDQLISGLNSDLTLEESRVFASKKHLKDILHRKQEDVIEKLTNDKARYKFYMAVAYNFYDAGAYDESLPLFINGLKFAEKGQNLYAQCAAYNIIGNVFSEIKMFEKGVENLKTGIGLAIRSGHEDILSTLYSSLSNCYYRNADMGRNFIDSARKYNRLTIQLAEKFNQFTDMHISYQALGLMETDAGNYAVAEAAFRKAMALSPKLKDRSFLVYTQYQLARMYVEKGDIVSADSALKYLEPATDYARSYGDNELLNEIFYELAKVYSNKKDYKQSAYYALRFSELNDSLTKLENSKVTAELSEKYESAKKESMITELNLIQKEKQAQIDRQLYMIVGSVIVLLLVGVAVFSLYRSNQVRKKANKELSLKNELIENQKKEVEHQKELIEDKNKEILDSIRYAKRIQQSLLPTEIYIKRNIDKLKGEKG